MPVFLSYYTWYFYQQSIGAYQCRKMISFHQISQVVLEPWLVNLAGHIQSYVWIQVFSLHSKNRDVINSFLGPYCKLWNTISPLEFMAYTLHALAINLSRKNLVCNLQHRPGTQLVRVCNYLWDFQPMSWCMCSLWVCLECEFSSQQLLSLSLVNLRLFI